MPVAFNTVNESRSYDKLEGIAIRTGGMPALLITCGVAVDQLPV